MGGTRALGDEGDPACVDCVGGPLARLAAALDAHLPEEGERAGRRAHIESFVENAELGRHDKLVQQLQRRRPAERWEKLRVGFATGAAKALDEARRLYDELPAEQQQEFHREVVRPAFTVATAARQVADHLTTAPVAPAATAAPGRRRGNRASKGKKSKLPEETRDLIVRKMRGLKARGKSYEEIAQKLDYVRSASTLWRWDKVAPK